MLGFDARTATRYAEEVMKNKLSIELEPELASVAERQARASHEGWMKVKMDQGYVYGSETNDDPARGPLTNPLLVPYDELSDDVKASNIANAVAVLKILKNKKVTFVNFTQMILYPLAKSIHDEWCREKIQTGWTWGPETDKKKKIHRDLVPFETLLMNPELRDDIKYDVDTAKAIIIKLIVEDDLFPVIPNLSSFKLA